MAKGFGQLIFIIIAIIFELSVLSLLYPLNQIRLVLVIALIIALSDYKKALFWVFLGGLILDTCSVLPFSSITLSLFVAVTIIFILARNTFTSGSLYAVIALGIIGIVIYNLSLILLVHIFYLLKITDFQIQFHTLYSQDMFWQILLNTTLMVGIFWLRKRIKKRPEGAVLK
ncbi:hypothetical protein KKD19_06705 [Patescibacteria group bacterium]|nr:hypothetical protein [Patescibacteria group bacterium]MBU4512893.1 hypothetical protein [Patescibacteria group bacterium]MCG2692617.1 hypothetical protein [Candidatus Parcubacteria bacterium]